MSNLHEVRPTRKTITLSDGVEREVRFTLNAMAELEEKYGSVEAAFKALDSNSIKAARFILWAGLMDFDETLTEQQVGKLIDMNNLRTIMDSVADILSDDMPATPEQAEHVAVLPNV